jgi:hypothetical protein
MVDHRTLESLPSRILSEYIPKKEKELEVIEKFLGTLFLGHHQIEQRERPDFIIRFSNGQKAHNVGCELTCFYGDLYNRGSRERRFFAQWKKFVKELRAELDSCGDGLQYLYSAVHFKEEGTSLFDRVDDDKLKKELIAVIQANRRKTYIKKFDAELYPLLREHVEHLYVASTKPEKGSLWWCAHLQTGNTADAITGIINTIQSKLELSNGYDWSGVDEKWLLISAEGTGLMDVGFLDEDPNVSSRFSDLIFSRIYFWNRAMNQIHEVYPGFKPLADGTIRARWRSGLPEWALDYLTYKPPVIGNPT